jgi:glycine/D-amino acid oxidase-like deaminating enzyme
MRTRYGISPWIALTPKSRVPDYSRLRGSQTADVVIIGGGITGCATAYACALAGVRAIVLEADRVGQGSGGRSAGLLLPDPGPAFRDIEQMHGRRPARTAFDSWRRASLEGAALLRRLNIKCGLEPVTPLIVAARDPSTALGAGAEKTLQREFDARSKAGVGGSWLTRKLLGSLTAPDMAPAAIRMRDACVLDAYRACLGLSAAAASRGAVIFERSRVRKVKVARRHVDVIAEGGQVRASTVIVATGTATMEFRQLRRHFKRRESYLVLTEPMPAAIRKQLGRRDTTFRDTRDPHRRVRFTEDGRILVAGATQDETAERKRPAILVQRTGQLMYELLTMFPVISGLMPEYGWELISGETADGLMYIGPHRNYPRHLFALGSGGDSVTGSFLAARILVRTLQNASEKEDEVWSWTR